nr:MAG: movement protein [Sanya phenuivirus 1]
MGLFNMVKSSRKGNKREGGSSRARKEISMSKDHEHVQVIGFQNTANDGSRAAEMGRELFAFPKPSEPENMAKYIENHKDGDIFPFVAVTGKDKETKESRLARMRAFVSPYGKVVKPEMRVNGIILDMLTGSLHLDDLKSHVDGQRLNRQQKRENKSFKLDEHVFSKPYLQLRKITGEFVPLLSGTADYTELIFSLQDERLLEHQVIVQSDKIPTNSVGIFELSCDYCIPTKDVQQLALKYELARPIMKEDFQWGAVSLSISLCEADTPYLTPKIEAMALVKAPFTSLEDHDYDQDHKDVTYTSGQIKKFREMYQSGDIADNDEPLKERMKKSSYAKSTIRGIQKSTKGPEHVGNMAGWEHMKDMRKPLLPEDEVSVDVGSDENEVEISQTVSAAQWKAEQERMRKLYNPRSSNKVDRMQHSVRAHTPPPLVPDTDISSPKSPSVHTMSDDSEPMIYKKARQKRVGFNVHDV